MTSDYNGFSGDERKKSTPIIEEAIKNGELKPYEETKCFICGQDKGIRDYHCENYLPEKVVGNAIPLCKKCHSWFHGSKITNPKKFRHHLEEVREIPLPPTYRKDSWLPERDIILNDYHGFSAEIREFSKHIIEKAIEDGELKPLNETECSICGQYKGFRTYNVEDYSSPEAIIKSARPLCWTCNEYVERHEEKNPEIYEKYVKEVQEKPRDPVYIKNAWEKKDDLLKLSKSKYCACVQCKKMFWLRKYKPNSAAGKDKTAIFATGREVGELAKGLFGDYEDVPYDETLTPMVETTEVLLENKPNVITEASFTYDYNFCSVDILKNDKDGVEIYEVKNSGGVKSIYLDDVAYQYYVLDNLGFNVKKACIVHLDTSYIIGEELDLQKLFHIEDVTDKAKEKQCEVRDNIEEFRKFMKEHGEDNEPNMSLGINCCEPYSCDFWQYCTKCLPKPNVFDIKWMSKEEKFEKYDEGKISFEELASKDEHFSRYKDKIKMQIEFENDDKEPYIDEEYIEGFLDLEYPLYFIDYEACQYAIPKYKDTKPYQQIPFQYSLHIIKEKDAPPEHKEYLGEVDDENLIRDFAENMINEFSDNFDENGLLKDCSVIVYNKTFEETHVNKELARMFPDLKAKIESINANMVDLEVPFRNRKYYVKEMKGRSSLKYVLPALYPPELYPELDYSKLPVVHDGGEAPQAFLSLKDKTPKEQEKIREGLKAYCKLDTLAMVKILEKLQRI